MPSEPHLLSFREELQFSPATLNNKQKPAAMLKFAGLHFRGLSLEDLFRPRDGLTQVVTVNAEYIVRAHRDGHLRRIINSNVATFDGQVPYAIARLRHRNHGFSKISGSDLIYHICERAMTRGERVFLLGGLEESNRRSIAVLRGRYAGLDVEGYSPPIAPYPFPPEHGDEILDRIRRFRPHYLLVGFGAGKQDFWIDDHRGDLGQIGVGLAVGVGGVFEIVSGKFKRAPRALQHMGVEGVYRLLKEPKLFRLQRLLMSFGFLRYVWRRTHGASSKKEAKQQPASC